MMPSLGCLWNRPRLERLVDGALGPRAGRAATSHAARCPRCGGEVEQLTRLRLLIRSSAPDVADPDWAGFWPAVRVRLARPGPLAEPAGDGAHLCGAGGGAGRLLRRSGPQRDGVLEPG